MKQRSSSSLGTKVMGGEKGGRGGYHGSDSDTDAEGDRLFISAPLASGAPKPWFPPPPRVPLKDGGDEDKGGGVLRKKVRVREGPAPIPPLPPLPKGVLATPIPPPPLPKHGPRGGGDNEHANGIGGQQPQLALKSAMKRPRGAAVERSKSRRKTLLEKFDGWWDLGIIDSHRQTLIARGHPRLDA